MIKRFLVPLALLLLAACDSGSHLTAVATRPAATPTAASAAAASPTPVAAAATAPAATAATGAAPNGAEALRHVQALAADIGPRVATTDAARQAADYIAGRLRGYGYDVELQPFTMKVFTSRSVSFEVDAPQQESLHVAPLTNSAPGSASGDLFVAGTGRPEDYPAGGIGGRIALVQRGDITFGDKVRNAAAAGAAAMVVYEPGNDVVPGQLTGTIPAIPALTIPGADGVRLRAQAQSAPVRVNLSFDGGVEEGTAVNVVGRPPGKGCAVVVGGHYDTVAGAPGGSDNASGTAAMLELARVQGLRGNPEQACFIAFSGEEEGLLGSQYFVGHLSDAERKAIRFMLNLDMVSVGDEWWLVGTRALQVKGQEIASAEGISAQPRDLIGASSDHAAFIDRRVPALLLYRSNDSLLHTPQDTADRITARSLEAAVRLAMALLTGLGSS